MTYTYLCIKVLFLFPHCLLILVYKTIIYKSWPNTKQYVSILFLFLMYYIFMCHFVSWDYFSIFFLLSFGNQNHIRFEFCKYIDFLVSKKYIHIILTIRYPVFITKINWEINMFQLYKKVNNSYAWSHFYIWHSPIGQFYVSRTKAHCSGSFPPY